jgi:hypothetical protein
MQIIKLHFDSNDPLPGISQPGHAEALGMPKNLMMAGRFDTAEPLSFEHDAIVEDGGHVFGRHPDGAQR